MMALVPVLVLLMLMLFLLSKQGMGASARTVTRHGKRLCTDAPYNYNSSLNVEQLTNYLDIFCLILFFYLTVNIE